MSQSLPDGRSEDMYPYSLGGHFVTTKVRASEILVSNCVLRLITDEFIVASQFNLTISSIDPLTLGF